MSGSITNRQSNIFVAEDWQKIYSTFSEADFQSYDFETIRKSMVEYLRSYYPEDFNDFIESSEYVALLDLLAFLGQSLSFRNDLNSRDNFLATSERRDSILRLARMLSYNTKRNIPASGLLKITSVQSTETIIDSNGINLSNLNIRWNDSTNLNWQEQFTLILNAAYVSTQKFGKPYANVTINNITTQEYQLNILQNSLPIYPFTTNVDGTSMNFEIVSPTTAGANFIYERSPQPGAPLHILYRNDNKGNNSVNTGFFAYFKQGELQGLNFSINESIPNRIVNLAIDNINNSDVWLFEIDSNNNLSTEWTQVPALVGNNIIYNNIVTSNRNLFSVNSRANDQIDLIFGDGVFSNIPTGNFKSYVRTSNGLSYKVLPSDVQNFPISINYISRTGRLETLTVGLSLQYTVNNSATRELVTDIKIKAPQQYYTQDRMITGEDYNILPYTLFSTVSKVKAVNRTSSGISRFLDLSDPTGKYSSTNIFATDGAYYRNDYVSSFNFDFSTINDINKVLINQINPLLSSVEMQQYYYKEFPRVDINSTLFTAWTQVTSTNGDVTGYFAGDIGNPVTIDFYTGSIRKYIKLNSLVKFIPPPDQYFDKNNALQTGTPTKQGDTMFLWATVTNIVADGTAQGLGTLTNGMGPVTLNIPVPSNSVVAEVIVPFASSFGLTLQQEIVNNIRNYSEFGLRFDTTTQTWKIITETNLNKSQTFSLANQGDVTNNRLDNSWLILFTNQSNIYTVEYRGLTYYFESELEARFYFDPNIKIFDPKTGKTVKDLIRLLSINTQPDTNQPLFDTYDLQIYDVFTEADGYVDNDKVKVTFQDNNNDGIPDNPDIFELLVSPSVNPLTKYVYFCRIDSDEGDFEPIDSSLVVPTYGTSIDIERNKLSYVDGQVFFAHDENNFYVLSVVNNVYTVTLTLDYKAVIGRDGLYFHYVHNSPNYRRIDPVPTNLIDLFFLTSQYVTDYANYLSDTTNSIAAPAAPTADELANEYSALEKYKSVSDTIVYNSVKYKPLFGPKADPELQSTFEVIKNPQTSLSDAEIKSRIISAFNDYFNVSNWNFGDTFYFTELAAYVHNQLAPHISSIVIVPTGTNQVFGSLFQIQSLPNEIFINAATVNNIDIITDITATNIRASGTVINITSTTNNPSLLSGGNSF